MKPPYENIYNLKRTVQDTEVSWDEIQGKPFETVGNSLSVSSTKKLEWNSDYVTAGDGIEIDNQPDGKIKIINTSNISYNWGPSQSWTGTLTRIFEVPPAKYAISILRRPVTSTGLQSFSVANGFFHILLDGGVRGLYDFSVCYGISETEKPFIAKCDFKTVYEEGTPTESNGRPKIVVADIDSSDYLWISFCNEGYTPADGNLDIKIDALLSNLSCTGNGTVVDFLNTSTDRLSPFNIDGCEKINITYVSETPAF